MSLLLVCGVVQVVVQQCPCFDLRPGHQVAVSIERDRDRRVRQCSLPEITVGRALLLGARASLLRASLRLALVPSARYSRQLVPDGRQQPKDGERELEPGGGVFAVGKRPDAEGGEDHAEEGRGDAIPAGKHGFRRVLGPQLSACAKDVLLGRGGRRLQLERCCTG